MASASNNVNSTADVARGILNQSESKALDNGYKFVWEFTPWDDRSRGADLLLGRDERLRKLRRDQGDLSDDEESEYRGCGGRQEADAL